MISLFYHDPSNCSCSSHEIVSDHDRYYQEHVIAVLAVVQMLFVLLCMCPCDAHFVFFTFCSFYCLIGVFCPVCDHLIGEVEAGCFAVRWFVTCVLFVKVCKNVVIGRL